MNFSIEEYNMEEVGGRSGSVSVSMLESPFSGPPPLTTACNCHLPGPVSLPFTATSTSCCMSGRVKNGVQNGHQQWCASKAWQPSNWAGSTARSGVQPR